MMGVQILDGDWNAEVAGAASEGDTTTRHPSARQRRWTAFRSWYRGGRVFDRADETLIAAATLRRPPSPGSLGRPLTPRMAPVDGPQPAAPTTSEEEVTESPPLTSKDEGDAGGSETAAVSPEVAAVSHATGVTVTRLGTAPVTSLEGMYRSPEVAAVSDETGGTATGLGTAPVTPTEGMYRERRTTPPVPPAPPGASSGARAVVQAALLNTNQPTPARVAQNGQETSVHFPAKDDGPLRDEVDRGVDAARLAGIAGWDAEEEEGGQNPGGDDGACEGELTPISHQSRTTTAKRLRMEARRKFLAARTVNSKQAAQKVRRTRSGLLVPLV